MSMKIIYASAAIPRFIAVLGVFLRRNMYATIIFDFFFYLGSKHLRNKMRNKFTNVQIFLCKKFLLYLLYLPAERLAFYLCIISGTTLRHALRINFRLKLRLRLGFQISRHKSMLIFLKILYSRLKNLVGTYLEFSCSLFIFFSFFGLLAK